MAHHRCTGCKKESYPRHKYYNGVFCDDCIREIRGLKRPHFVGTGFLGILSFVRDFYHRVKAYFLPKAPPTAEQIKASKEREVYIRLKVMEARARKIPIDKRLLTPQKY